MKGRDRFQCTNCGVVIEGRMIDGVVRSYDRAGWNGSPVKPMRCIACKSAQEEAK